MIRLHHVPFARSFRVLWMLEEMGLAYEVRRYSIRDGSLRDPAFRAVSPAGRVPALEIDGVALFESGAILDYLAETRPEHGFGCPPGHPDRARHLEAMAFAETMASLIEQLNLSHVFLRPPAKASPQVVKIVTLRLAATLKALERLVGEGPWLLKKGFGAADMMMGFNLRAAPYFVDLAATPGVAAYAARMAERAGYGRAMAQDGPQDFYDRPFYPIPEG